MVRLAFLFDNFTIPPPSESRFRHQAGGDDENIANFQGVPYTLDQDCSQSTRQLTSQTISQFITQSIS